MGEYLPRGNQEEGTVSLGINITEFTESVRGTGPADDCFEKDKDTVTYSSCTETNHEGTNRGSKSI